MPVPRPLRRAMSMCVRRSAARSLPTLLHPPGRRAALALRDGWAVAADATADAGSYAPAPLPPPFASMSARRCRRIPTRVAPLDAVTAHGDRAEALAPVVAGDGVLPAGADAGSEPLRRAGERLRRTDIAALLAAGINRVTVREPRVRIVRAGAAHEVIDAAVALIAGAIESRGRRRARRAGIARSRAAG